MSIWLTAQGEDLVAGVRTPLPLSRSDRRVPGETTMEELFPRTFEELRDLGDVLERHYRDMQDIEFTIQQDRLWLLQTRSGKRTVRAALKIACDLASEGLIAEEEAVRRIDPRLLEQILHPVLDPDADRETILNGLPASPGAASGRVVLTADDAERLASQGQRTILVRMETSPEDIHGMHAAAGILTGRGGMTSHAAVVARGMGRPCVVGAGELRIDDERQCLEARGETVSAGDFITIDGSSGEVMKGVIPSMEPDLPPEFERLMAWADNIRETGVRANAETPDDAETAFKLGAEGIGLCRTEHMFFEPGRLLVIREMILAPDDASRRRALDKLLEMQRSDLTEIFRIAAGKPVAIRLLDPPLHEFLPGTYGDINRLAEALGTNGEEVRARIVELQEINPMLGLRGCRLALLFPEIAEMQARAIFEAAVSAATPVAPEIMIPLIMGKAELDLLKEKIAGTARRVMEETGAGIHYQVGTMIELPSAALRAGEIAETAEFFSFGTNDLTQTTLGLSRDDTANLVRSYTRRGILEADPFVTLDVGSVGELVELAIDRGRRTRADLKLGLCGEHGGDPDSIRFCVEVGLDYVSCSPYRVPVARLAAAQAALDRRVPQG